MFKTTNAMMPHFVDADAVQNENWSCNDFIHMLSKIVNHKL